MEDIGKVKIFSDLSERSLRELQEEIKYIEYGPEEIIFQEGAPSFGFYIIHKGLVKLVKRTLRGKKQILKMSGPGEFIGETTLFDKGAHIAFAKTLTETKVGFIERGNFFYFLEKHPEIVFRIFAKMSEEMKAFQSKLAERSYNSSKERLARFILRLGKEGIELSRSELAELAGVSSKTAIRTLGELEDRGFIKMRDRKIEILDEDSIANLATTLPISLDKNIII
ncbi:MAG: Crp/Fnr family transcriptional regulator [Candidatus Acetothermia bacterium]|nr:Crp/Fnr family transcriptional regulator [Candidatus Bipolaricaulota bacterium]